jgi:hypothetical protein
MRELGLNATSAGAIRIVRRHVVRLGLDTSHFRGKRKWSDVQLKRVQVKTTTHYSRNGWMITVGRRPYSIRKDVPLIPYDPDLIDSFFMVDGDLNMYLIPSRVIAGRVSILLRTYARYVVGNASGLLGPAAPKGTPGS